MPITKLQPPALSRYNELKQIVREGSQTFIAVGMAIAEIKERKLYEAEYESFAAFCEKEYGWGTRHCNELSQAAKAVKALPPAQAKAVTSIKAAKAVAQIPGPPAKKAAVVQAATRGGKATEKAIKAATPPAKPAAVKQRAPMGPVDSSGLLIPASLLPLWHRSEEVSVLLLQVSRVRTALGKAEKEQDILFAQLSYNSALSHLDQVYSDLKASVPAYVCPICGGNEQVTKSCTLCKGLGLLSEFYWRAVSVDLKELRRIAIEQQNVK